MKTIDDLQDEINIKRNDDIYLEIERFKDYEIMVGIVYEMFIRSNENNDSLIKRDKDSYKNNTYYKIGEFSIGDVILFQKDNEKYTLSNIIFTVFPELYKDITLKDYSNIDDISVKFIIDKYINNNNAKFVEVVFYDKEQNKFISLTKKLLSIYINQSLFRFKSYNIIPNYSRPQIISNVSKFVNIYNLNLSLSNKDINKILDKVRNELKINNETIYNTYVKTYYDDETKLTNFFKYKKKFINKKIYRNPITMANLFFTYDVFNKLNEKNYFKTTKIEYIRRNIEKHLTEYNEGKIKDHEVMKKYINKDSIDDKTIESYYSDAKDLIEKKYYKYLI